MKRRIYTINGKIPVITSDMNLVTDKEIPINKIANTYTISVKNKHTDGFYYSTASFTENVEFNKEEGVEIKAVVSIGNSTIEYPLKENVIPAYNGVLIKSNKPVSLNFTSTDKTLEYPILNNAVGFDNDYLPSQIIDMLPTELRNRATVYSLSVVEGVMSWYRARENVPCKKGKAVLIDFK